MEAIVDRAKTIRTWRLAITCVFLFIISWYFEIPESSWSLVTIWFVMYEYTTVGGVLNKSLLRFTGTILSALYGVLIIYFCGNNPIINIAALIAGLFLYSYFFMGSEKSYTGTIGAVTLTIVLLNYNNIDVAMLRVMNVVIGIVASVFMIRFFYPQYARNLIIENQVIWFNRLLHLISVYLDPKENHNQLKEQCSALDSQVQAEMSNYNRLVTEALLETPKTPFFITNSKGIRDQFQLLFRLFSIYLSILSTTNHATHPWVVEHMQAMSKKLQCIKGKLLCIELDLPVITPSTLAKKNNEEDVDSIEFVLENKGSIKALFQDMNKAISLLEQEVDSLILAYEYYDYAIEPHLKV